MPGHVNKQAPILVTAHPASRLQRKSVGYDRQINNWDTTVSHYKGQAPARGSGKSRAPGTHDDAFRKK